MHGIRKLTGTQQQLGSPEQLTIGGIPESVVPHFVHSLGKHMLQESPDELVSGEGHEPPVSLAAFLIAESDSAVLDTDQATIGKRGLV